MEEAEEQSDLTTDIIVALQVFFANLEKVNSIRRVLSSRREKFSCSQANLIWCRVSILTKKLSDNN